MVSVPLLPATVAAPTSVTTPTAEHGEEAVECEGAVGGEGVSSEGELCVCVCVCVCVSSPCSICLGDVGRAVGYIEIDEQLFAGDVPVDEDLFDVDDIQNLRIDDLGEEKEEGEEEEGRDSDAESVE